MARVRKRQTSRKTKPAEFVAPPSGETSIFGISIEPILRHWRARYAEIEVELSQLSTSTEDFHLRALPAYQAWVARQFGKELGELRTMQETLHESERLFQATLAEADASGLTESEAYQIVLLRKKRGEDLFPSYGESDEDWESGWSDVDPERDYREEEASERKSKAESSDPKADGDAKSEPNDETFDPQAEKGKSRKSKNEETPQLDLFAEKTTPVEPEAARIRTLYRKLVFALHPDTNPAQTARERKIWIEVQEAYSAKDLDRLEMLVAWVESGLSGGIEKITHVGTLQAFVSDKIRELRAVRSKFKRLRKERAWTFWTKKESERSLEELRGLEEEDIVHDFLLMQRSLREFERQFGQWTNFGSGRRRPRR